MKQNTHPNFYKSSIAVFEEIFQDGMPDICTGGSDSNSYSKAYVDTYIEKDIRKLISASSKMQFR